MMKIDNPIDQIDAQNPPAGPGGEVAAVLNVAGLLLALVPGAAPVSAASQLFAFSKQFLDAGRNEARASAFVTGLRDGLGDCVQRLEVLEKRVIGPSAEEAVVVAIQRATNAARLDKARMFGRVVGATAAQESPNWEEAAQFIRDLEQFTDSDIKTLRVLWRVQRASCRVVDGRPTMSTDANDYTRQWNEVLERAKVLGVGVDDWYSQCGRLNGFGLVLVVPSSAAFQGADATCYRVTGRAARLLDLLGVAKAPSPYPSWRYHPVHEGRIVHDEDEDRVLGEGWADSPAAFTKT
jgi:hypothetical protein